MAAGDSPTGIANLALAMLSEDPIANIDPPDGSKRGRLCRQWYDPSRRAMLEAAPWRCAKTQATLAASATAPSFTYGAAYPLPADYIRMFDLPEDGGMQWEIMNLPGIGLCILSDAGGPLEITYVWDLQDARQFSPLLVMAIAAELAANLAWPLARDMSLKQSCLADRDGYLAAARTASAQQASPRLFDADVLLRARW